jgi:hypothetical protein
MPLAMPLQAGINLSSRSSVQYFLKFAFGMDYNYNFQ